MRKPARPPSDLAAPVADVPAGTVARRVGYQLKRAQHALRLAMDDALAPLALTTAQYAVLSALEDADAAEAARSGAALARRCFVTPQTMTGLVAALERGGLVDRRPHPTHGRVLEVVMTAAGRRTLARAHAAVLAVEERMLAGVGAAARAALAARLADCADALHADRPDDDPRG